MDTVGNKAAKDLIAMIKIVAPNVALDVLDRAIQIHGAVGVSQDTFLAHQFAGQRTLRLADGPDQVHMMQLGRNLARHYSKPRYFLSTSICRTTHFATSRWTR